MRGRTVSRVQKILAAGRAREAPRSPEGTGRRRPARRQIPEEPVVTSATRSGARRGARLEIWPVPIAPRGRRFVVSSVSPNWWEPNRRPAGAPRERRSPRSSSGQGPDLVELDEHRVHRLLGDAPADELGFVTRIRRRRAAPCHRGRAVSCFQPSQSSSARPSSSETIGTGRSSRPQVDQLARSRVRPSALEAVLARSRPRAGPLDERIELGWRDRARCRSRRRACSGLLVAAEDDLDRRASLGLQTARSHPRRLAGGVASSWRILRSAAKTSAPARSAIRERSMPTADMNSWKSAWSPGRACAVRMLNIGTWQDPGADRAIQG